MALKVAIPAMRALGREFPRLRCELREAEPEERFRRSQLGDVDLVLADEWQHQPRPRPAGVDRLDLHRDPVYLMLPADHPAARRRKRTARLADLAGEAWTTGYPGAGWEQVVQRTCRELGGFEPDIRHRTNDSVISLALVAAGQAVMLLPELVGADPTRAWPCAPSPRARWSARSSPPPARPTPSARRCGC